MSERSNDELLELSREVGGEREGRFGAGVGGSSGSLSPSRGGVVLVDLLLRRLEFLGLFPHSRPISIRLRPRSSSNGLEDVLGGVVARSAAEIGVSVEVVDHRERVRAQIAKVNRLTSLGPIESATATESEAQMKAD